MMKQKLTVPSVKPAVILNIHDAVHNETETAANKCSKLRHSGEKATSHHEQDTVA